MTEEEKLELQNIILKLEYIADDLKQFNLVQIQYKSKLNSIGIVDHEFDHRIKFHVLFKTDTAESTHNEFFYKNKNSDFVIRKTYPDNGIKKYLNNYIHQLKLQLNNN